MENKNKTITTREIMKLLHVNGTVLSTIRNAPNSDMPKPIEIINSCYLYDRAEIMAWIEKRQTINIQKSVKPIFDNDLAQAVIRRHLIG